MMHPASWLDGFQLDVFPPCEDGLSTAEVDIGRGQVVETLVIAPQVVVVDELGEALFELTWQVVVLRVGSGSSWSGDSARSCPGSSGDKACRGYGSCRAPASQEPSW